MVVAIVAYFCPPLAGAVGSWAGGVAAGAGASAATAVAVANAAYWATIGAVSGFAGGAVNSALNGGDLGDVLRAGLIGGIQGAITAGVLHGMEPGSYGFSWEMAQHVAGHGIVGGAANVAMGGKFGDGFLSASASAFAGNMGWLGGRNVASRTIKASIVGGTASVLGGGKFANGAYTSAFQHLLNAEAPSKIQQWVEKYRWSEEYRAKQIAHFKSMSNRELGEYINNVQHGLYIDNPFEKSQIGKFEADEWYKQWTANQQQSLDAANMVLFSLIERYQFTLAIGYSSGVVIGGNVGIVMGPKQFGFFWGSGLTTPSGAPFLSFTPGVAPQTGSSVAYSAAYFFGFTLENGDPGITVAPPGTSRMSNHYKVW